MIKKRKLMFTKICLLILIVYTLIPASGIELTVQAVEENVIEISSAEDLAKVGREDTFPADGKYRLTSNIDLSNIEDWEPLPSFNGIFEGGGYTISNLKISKGADYRDPRGLFVKILSGGTIRNLHIVNAVVNGGMETGVLAGRVDKANIEYVSVSGQVDGITVVGGLAGYAVDTNISYSSFSGNVKGQTTNIGGLVGYQLRGSIIHSLAAGTLAGQNTSGGIAGTQESGEIIKTYATVKMEGNGGGLVGEQKSGTISDSYYDSDVSGKRDTGKGIPKTTSEMKRKSTFTGWDFNHIWIMTDDKTYPELRAFVIDLRGKGTEADPYVIQSGYQFNRIRENPNAHYIIVADIDLSMYPKWNSIDHFAGTIDGKGHRISNISIEGSNSLIYKINEGGVIKNVQIKNAVLQDNFDTFVSGSLLASENNGLIQKVMVDGKIELDESLGQTSGIVSRNRGTIENAHFNGEFDAKNAQIGGLVFLNTGKITHSSANVKMEVVGGSGGLVALNEGIIESSYADVEMKTSIRSAGLVSINFNNGKIINSFATGIIDSDDSTEIASFVSNNGGKIDYSYGSINFMGKTSGKKGLVALGFSGGSVNNSYWDETKAGVGAYNSVGGLGKTTAEMQQQSTFTGWDFEHTWFMINGQMAPVLKRSAATNPILTLATQDTLLTYGSAQELVVEGDIDHVLSGDAAYIEYSIENENGKFMDENGNFTDKSVYHFLKKEQGLGLKLHFSETIFLTNNLPLGTYQINVWVKTIGATGMSDKRSFTIKVIEEPNITEELTVGDKTYTPGTWTNQQIKVKAAFTHDVPTERKYALLPSGNLLTSNDWHPYEEPLFIQESGSYDLYLKTKNASGFEKELEIKQLKLDKDTPPSPAIALSEREWTNQPVTATVTAEDVTISKLAQIDIKVGEEDWAEHLLQPGHTTVTKTIRAEGETKVYARSVNNAGTRTLESEAKIRIDTTKPEKPQFSIENGTWYHENFTIEIISGKDDLSGVSYTEYRMGDSEWTKYTGELSINEQVVDSDGLVRIEARTIDNAGNIGISESIEVGLDTVKPTRPLIKVNPSEWTNENVFVTIDTVSSGLSPLDQIEYRIGGEKGEWLVYTGEIQYQKEGKHLIESRVWNQAGSVSEVATNHILIDKTAPTEPEIIADTEEWTNNNVSVKLEDGKDEQSGVAYTEYHKGDGNWIRYSSPLIVENEGVTTIFARTVDKLGHRSPVTQKNIKIDRTRPAQPKLEGLPKGWTNQPVLIVVKEDREVVGPSGWKLNQYRINGGEWKTVTGGIDFQKDGVYEIEARTINHAGNISEIIKGTISLDTTAPSRPVVTPETSSWTNKPVKVNIQHGNPGLSGVSHTEYKIGSGGQWQTYKDNFTITSEGEHYIYARTWDQAGNVTPESELGVSVIRIDKTIPMITIDMYTSLGQQYESGTWSKGNVEVTANFQKNGKTDIQIKKYSVDGGKTWNDYSGRFTISKEGMTNLHIKAVDESGNEVIEERVVKIDKTGPEQALITLSKNGWSQQAVSVTITPGKDAHSGTSHAEYLIEGTGSWQKYSEPFSINAEGKTMIIARTVDNIGNVSTETYAVVQIDRTGPEKPNITLSNSDWTNKDVRVEISNGRDHNSGSEYSEYRINQGVWTRYQSPFNISSEGETVIEARTIDKAGNVGLTSETVVKIERRGPEIELIGYSEIIMEAGTSYLDQGAKATHPRFGNITADIVVEGEVDFHTPGTYVLNFSVTDKAGNLSKVQRKITVVEIKGLQVDDLPSEVEVGAELQVSLAPIYAGELIPSIVHKPSFTINNSAVANVTKSGKITFQQSGEVTLTVSYGSIQKEIRFTVYNDKIYENKKRAVFPGRVYRLVGSTTSITMPTDLPAGIKLLVNKVKPDHLTHPGLKAFGDVYSFTISYPTKGHSSKGFRLTMGYSDNAPDGKVAIYYFNEDKQKWEFRGGENDLENQLITILVPHFSTYGVFADEEAPNLSLKNGKVSTEQFELKWEMDDASPIVAAELRRNGKVLTVLDGTEGIFTDTSILPGKEYSYSLWARDYFGNEQEVFMKVNIPVNEENVIGEGPKQKNENKKEKEVEKGSIVGKKGSKQIKHGILPNTATPLYNILVIGFLLLALGLLLLRYKNMKRS